MLGHYSRDEQQIKLSDIINEVTIILVCKQISFFTNIYKGALIMNNMILIDIETQDFPVASGIFEVACLAIENYKIVDQLYLGVTIEGYKGPIDFGRGFHDISCDILEISKFKSFISKYSYPIVAHNCPFEKKFLIHYGWLSESYPLYCSMRAIRYEKLGLQKHTMESLVNHFNIEQKSDHTAMGDVIALFEILKLAQPITWLRIGEKRRYKR